VTDLSVRPAADADLRAVMEAHKRRNDFGGKWFTNPYAGGKEARWEDLTPAQRYLHGGPWMDPQLLALHVRRFAEAKGSVLVAERGGKVVGEIEMWPAEEPLPFGAYLDIATLTAEPPGDAGVERALIEAAVREARARDLRALDIAPLHAGGDPALLSEAGFEVHTELRTVHLEAGRRPKPPEYGVLSTAPSLSDLRDMVAMDHREPADFRLGNLGNGWSAGLLRDVSQAFGALLRVGSSDLGVTGRVDAWFPEPEAEVDLWVSTRGLGNMPWFLRAAAAAMDHVAAQVRAVRYRTTVRSHLVPALQRIGFVDGADPDPWLRKPIALRNL
jgi:hypothetical protein